MFNPVVQVNFLQIKRIAVVFLVKHAGSGEACHVGKRSAEVVRRMNMFGKFGEADAFSTAGHNS